VTVKSTVLGDVMPCGLVEIQSFIESAASVFTKDSPVRNISEFLTVCTASRPRRSL
jgi:hypothetical protein